MERYINLIKLLGDLAVKANSIEENWGHLRLYGDAHTELLKDFRAIQDNLLLLGFNSLAHLTVNGNQVAIADLGLYENIPLVHSWAIELNKIPLIAATDADGWHYNLFLETTACASWLRASNPLVKKHPFNEFTPLRIMIGDLAEDFGGDFIQFLNPNQILNLSATFTAPSITAVNPKLPIGQALQENVHFITNEDIHINLPAYFLHSSSACDLRDIFLYKACQVLSMYLLDEYYSKDKVIINGIKRMVMKLDDGSASISEDFYNQLFMLIIWVYEDRVNVRKKLFNERITLDMEDGEALLSALSRNIRGAAEQAKERYNFVIIERKDTYVKELKELLKDIRNQSELYSGKIRTLLSNFLRDLLAAIVLVGFTIFTKITESNKLINEDLLNYVFSGLALYYLISISLQAIVDISDITVSKKEMIYWKNATKELLPEKEFRQHIHTSLKGRKNSLRILYPIIAASYLLIALTCYKYPVIFKEFLAKNQAKKNQLELEAKKARADSVKMGDFKRKFSVKQIPGDTSNKVKAKN